MRRKSAHVIVLSLSTGVLSVSSARAAATAATDPPAATPESRVDTTAIAALVALVNYFCQFFPCEDGSALEAQMASQSSSWRTHGLPTGLTLLQRAQAVSNAIDARTLILSNPGMVSPEVESDYLDMLRDIIFTWSISL